MSTLDGNSNSNFIIRRRGEEEASPEGSRGGDDDCEEGPAPEESFFDSNSCDTANGKGSDGATCNDKVRSDSGNEASSFYQSVDEDPLESEDEGEVEEDKERGDDDDDHDDDHDDSRHVLRHNVVVSTFVEGSGSEVDDAPIPLGRDHARDNEEINSFDSNRQATTTTSVESEAKGGDARLGTAISREEEGKADGTNTAYTADSDLSLPDRKIWIVTTAAMPWRTGTAVNPLLRALYLAKNRPQHSVTLLVPWLDDSRDPTTAKAHQLKLYGQVFAKPTDQEAWIREYCRTRCGCDPKEEALLRIRFWRGVYHDGFGSIFPSEDICALIPAEEADVAILEEPEHLNWFRVPKAVAEEVRSVASRIRETTGTPNQPTTAEPDSVALQSQLRREEQLGWKAKFRHVVGVLHTNYAAYIRQYGMGTSLLTAPALNALSSLVVRAYCHRVIRLSNCLPSLDAKKEVTENIHGVRSEFLQASSEGNATAPTSDVAPVYFIGKLIWAKGFDRILELQQAYRDATGSYFAMDVYGGGNDEKAIRRAFFGRHGSRKHVVREEGGASNTDDQAAEEIQDDSASGKGPSEVFARSASLRKQLVEVRPDIDSKEEGFVSTTEPDGAVELVFAGGESIRAHIVLEDQTSDVTATSLMAGSFHDEATSSTSSSAPVIVPSDIDDEEGNEGNGDDVSGAVPDSRALKAGARDAVPPSRQDASFFHILGDLSGKTVSTGVETAEAGLQLMENVVQSLFGRRNKDMNYNHLDCSSSSSNSSVGGDSETENATETAGAISTVPPETTIPKSDVPLAESESEKATSLAKSRRPNPFGFVPPRARFKWRRHPLPARFMGVQDHIVVRDLPKQVVFLNMSTTEVLCTTTAEALAMGKFAVIPRHPSNEFFYDFPNCLAYEGMEDCVEKMVYALSHSPEPLSSSDAHRLSWEGATERLYAAARVSVAEAEEYKQKHASEDEKAAKLHIEGTTHSHNLRNFLNDKLLFEL